MITEEFLTKHNGVPNIYSSYTFEIPKEAKITVFPNRNLSVSIFSGVTPLLNTKSPKDLATLLKVLRGKIKADKLLTARMLQANGAWRNNIDQYMIDRNITNQPYLCLTFTSKADGWLVKTQNNALCEVNSRSAFKQLINVLRFPNKVS